MKTEDMTTVERIRALCQEKGVKVSALERDLGFGNGFLNPKKVKDIKVERLQAILDYLGVSLEEFWGLGSEKTQEIETALIQIKKVSPELYEGIKNGLVGQSKIAEKYNALDNHGKQVVESVLNLEYERCIGANPKPVTKVIPLFSQSFAAGPNDIFAEDAWEDYEVPEDSKADFAIRVSGDSMEPELHDGEIYLCKRRYPEIGEICVAMVNGGFYVKQFITDGHNIYLRSVNRARKDNDIDIMESGQYTGKCLGTVIHKRIPLVDQ